MTKVSVLYEPVLADARDTISATLGSELHGLYLYGSVATGQATAPTSDLDLSAIVTTERALDQCRLLGEELSARHRSTVREVGISAGLLETLLAPNAEGRAERCFLKHYCINVAGIDLRPDLPRFRPDTTIAREFIGDLQGKIALFGDRLRDAESAADVSAVALLVGRRLLMAAAVLHSVINGTWSTARIEGARLLDEHHPTYRRHTHRALAWLNLSSQPIDAGPTVHPPGREEVKDVLDDLGGLLLRDVRHHLPPRESQFS
ncbi:nucleotidyltransferase domain-containing protein [Actinopolymorpha alba]|uniref:nucleotidyltransferase domain-containing protein n=1 Tax=Actinopolymorpha alba TaxID=533267 RepID=UPI0012F62CBC|nr:nucleotidyltransferase domain-containing protein [Actinopolymorpha alba]